MSADKLDSNRSGDIPLQTMSTEVDIYPDVHSEVIITKLIEVSPLVPVEQTKDNAVNVPSMSSEDSLLDMELPTPRKRTMRNRARTAMKLDRKKSTLTLAEEWWNGKETVQITIPPFFMKWFFFFKYEEPPKHVKLLQQNAWAWRPRLNFWCVFPILVVFAAILILLGVPMLYSTHAQVFYFRTDYTYCTAQEDPSVLKIAILSMITHTNMLTKNDSNTSIADCNPPPNITSITIKTCDDYLNTIPKCVRAASRILFNKCTCVVSIEVKQRMKLPIFMYYELNNFYTSHRRLVQSWDGYHYRGERHTVTTRECYTYSTNNAGDVYFPCGMLPNSIFNDTISSLNFNISRKQISFPIFANAKYIDPNPTLKNTILSDTKPLPAWPKSIYNIENGILNEDFIVWNYPSAFPNFRKMYARLDNSLEIGVYNITVTYNYLVSTISARKFISLSTTSWIGGQPFGFIAYAFTSYGVLILITAFILLAIHFPIKRRNTKSFLQQPY